MRKSNSTISEENKSFWERENQANFARTRDISTLDYLSVADGALPFSTSATSLDEREAELEQRVRETSQRKMINLAAYSNTDLKEQYGVANLEELSNCDQNFLFFIRALANWGTYLYEKEEYARSRQIMEYSHTIGSDISSVYTVLGNIYAMEGDIAKVDELIAEVEQSDFSLKASIIKKLKICKLEY